MASRVGAAAKYPRARIASSRVNKADDARLVTAGADLSAARDSAEPTGRHEDRVFEIYAQLIVPEHGYGLTAVRRFLISFGPRQHTNNIPIAILFGLAAAMASDVAGSNPPAG